MDIKWTEESRINDFNKRAPAIINTELREEMIKKGFFKGPSSKENHGAFEGGNFWHSRMVAMLLREYTDKMELQWERPESPEIIGWCHDLCKMDEYIAKTEENGNKYYEWNKMVSLSGHGDKSAIIILSKMYLTDEEIMCIRWHMGAFEGKESWNSYCAAVKKYPNILWTHQADMVASQVADI